MNHCEKDLIDPKIIARNLLRQFFTKNFQGSISFSKTKKRTIHLATINGAAINEKFTTWVGGFK